ncbi:hypothetical protein JTE90_012382, partial [Oedothorax gibbosus]
MDNLREVSTGVEESTNLNRSQNESFNPPMDEFEEISILSAGVDESTNLDTVVNESFDAPMDEFEAISLSPAGVDNQTEKDFSFPDDHSNVEYEFRNCMKKKDVMAMILAFALRFKVSGSGIESLINMINVIVGQELIHNKDEPTTSDWNTSMAVVKTIFCFDLLLHAVHLEQPAESVAQKSKSAGFGLFKGSKELSEADETVYAAELKYRKEIQNQRRRDLSNRYGQDSEGSS